MRAFAIEVADTSARVVLKPCLLARLFGARTVAVELCRTRRSSGRPGFDEVSEWQTLSTARKLDDVPHGAIIRDALDFRVAEIELPTAMIRSLTR